jgi:hypothetical protein
MGYSIVAGFSLVFSGVFGRLRHRENFAMPE